MLPARIRVGSRIGATSTVEGDRLEKMAVEQDPCICWLVPARGRSHAGAYILVRLGNAHHQKPLSVPVSLNKVSSRLHPSSANSSGDYLIDINWDLIPARQTSVDLDWKVIADNGSVISQGGFNNLLAAKHHQALQVISQFRDNANRLSSMSMRTLIREAPKPPWTSSQWAYCQRTSPRPFRSLPGGQCSSPSGAILCTPRQDVEALRRKRPGA